MEEEKEGVVSLARASSSSPFPPSAPPVSSSHPPMETAPPTAPAAQRQGFVVELRPGETTIVSWRRLVRDSNKGSGSSPTAPAGVHPALESRIAPSAVGQPAECEPKDDQPPPNRFSAVIEKIERLYMGKQSSDEEELDDIPDDDQYDTEDSFIDDAELDEYFQVDKLATKHNGFFVNRGKLEQIIEPSSSVNTAPRKRRRNESMKLPSEKDIERMPNELANKGNVRMKAAARTAPLVRKRSSSPRTITLFGEPCKDGNFSKNPSSASMGTCKKKTSDSTIKLENPPYVKMQNKDSLALPLESKDFVKQNTGVIQSRDLANKSRGASDSVDAMRQASHDKGVSSQVESQSRKLLNDENGIELSTKIRHREKNGINELPDLTYSGSTHPMQPVKPSIRVNEGSGVRPKGTTLERAIRDLEKIVLVSRPPNLDVPEADSSSQGVKKRLPQEVKQKLAKVARLAASQGKVSEEVLLDRLMGILGHLVQRKTLKKNLKEMVELGLSAKQLKADRFQQIKKEVIEMIRTCVTSLKSKVNKQPDVSSDDFQEVLSTEERRSLKAKCAMDNAIEDKISDLYDLYVEGMDEDKGPQIRKLYVELAEWWPNGYMDNVGIKDAVYRAKERKRALYKQQKDHNGERIRRKKLHDPAVKIEESATQARAGQDRPGMDTTGQIFVPSEKVISSSSGKVSHPMPSNGSGHHHGLKHQDKVRGGISASTVSDEGSRTAAAVMVKKLKRKSETDSGEGHVHPLKLPSLHAKEKHKSNNHSANPSEVHHHKSSLQSPCFQGSEQLS